jgi:hypothetical protein
MESTISYLRNLAIYIRYDNMSFSFKPHQVVEVSASSNPRDVIGAIVNASAPAKPALNPNRWFQFAFVFIVVFAMILWFREEIYTMTTGKTESEKAFKNDDLRTLRLPFLQFFNKCSKVMPND